MRINVYSEELTSETQLVSKEVTDEKFGTRTFYGIRVFLVSPKVLHMSEADDDRSAITLWIPWTKHGGHNPTVVREALEHLGFELDAAITAILARGDKLAYSASYQEHDDKLTREEATHPTRGFDVT
jgi:hypothetical protein